MREGARMTQRFADRLQITMTYEHVHIKMKMALMSARICGTWIT